MGLLELSVRRRLGDFSLDAEVACERGPLVIIGPSGAGKSLALRMIAGVVRPDAGRIAVNDRVLFDSAAGVDVPAQLRRVGYVPQEYALFSHLTAEGNIAFGLRGLSGPQRKARVREMLALTGLDEQRSLKPRQLSGGQRQRVALARALAVRPDVLLLDEPFAALDAPTRAALLEEVRSLIAKAGVASIFVTHDRNEALRLAETVAVMIDGRVRQVGTPGEVFGSPVDEETAAFVGVETIAVGRVRSAEGGVAVVEAGGQLVEGGGEVYEGDSVLVCVRPEDVVLAPAGAGTGTVTHEGAAAHEQTSARNHLRGRVVRVARAGPFVRVEVDVGFPLVALVTRHSVEDLGIAAGVDCVATFKASAVHLIRR
jgi:molybdate transport system ATP-binding protein